MSLKNYLFLVYCLSYLFSSVSAVDVSEGVGEEFSNELKNLTGIDLTESKKCQNKTECEKLGLHFTCVKGYCVCEKGYVHDEWLHKCTKSDLGDPCKNDESCSKENNEECDDDRKKCVCKYEFRPHNKFCVPDSKYCNRNKQCQVLMGKDSFCTGLHECACENGFFPDVNGKCQKSELGEKCKSKDICNHDNHEECVKEDSGREYRCRCKLNFKPFSGSEKWCISEESACSVNAQCSGDHVVCDWPSWIHNTFDKKECLCKKGFETKSGVCRAKAGYCDTEMPCKDLNAECFINACKCKDGYRNESGVCTWRPLYCDTSLDCRGDGSICKDHECGCMATYKYYGHSGNYVYCEDNFMSGGTIAGIVVPVVVIIIVVSILARCFLMRRRLRMSGQTVVYNNTRVNSGPGTQAGTQAGTQTGTQTGSAVPPGFVPYTLTGNDSNYPRQNFFSPAPSTMLNSVGVAGNGVGVASPPYHGYPPLATFVSPSQYGSDAVHAQAPTTPPPAYDAVAQPARNPFFPPNLASNNSESPYDTPKAPNQQLKY